MLADLIAGEGAQTLGVLYRQEAYGEGLANAIRENFEGLGGTVEPFIAYDTSAETFDAEVDQMVQADPDAIVVVGFVESATILTTMNERGIGPADKAVWGVDGNIGGIGTELQDPSIISGFRGTAPSVDLTTITDFTDRLDAAYPPDGVAGIFDYAAETYDAMVITALAAVLAGTDDPVQVAAQINGVTTGRHQVHHVRGVPAARRSGEDIDYDGLGGPYEFEDAGEPSAASFRVSTYDGEASCRTPSSTSTCSPAAEPQRTQRRTGAGPAGPAPPASVPGCRPGKCGRYCRDGRDRACVQRGHLTRGDGTAHRRSTRHRAVHGPLGRPHHRGRPRLRAAAALRRHRRRRPDCSPPTCCWSRAGSARSG